MGQIRVRVPDEADVEEMIVFDGLAFGSVWPENLRDLARATLDLDRFRVAHDGANLVGIAGSHAQEVTVPGQSAMGAAHGRMTP